MTAIQVVDVFAGPGGLGEGFSSFRSASGVQPFEIVVSIEKDEVAHATLRLRAFSRRFSEGVPVAYERLLNGRASWEDLRREHSVEAAAAEREALCAELGPKTASAIRGVVRERIDRKRPLVLIGGPPCQAYSLVGRARNSGNKRYDARKDVRQTLYVEYLQILADHAPDAFVMENVKGLLSARLEENPLFQLIDRDLRRPGAALLRSGRTPRNKRVEYELYALAADGPVNAPPSAADFVVRCENYGIPQRRHRVILVGLKKGLGLEPIRRLSKSPSTRSVEAAVGHFPPLRSGITRMTDSFESWLRQLHESLKADWYRSSDRALRAEIRDSVARAAEMDLCRGKEAARHNGGVILNHSSRAHMPEDLGRYLFASAHARINGVSPRLTEFPRALLPEHRNVKRALSSGLFSDRFRVQLAHAPATTITSHISKDGHYFIHPDPAQCRSLTVREAAELQTFPQDYFFCGPRTSQYQQVGNAVPPGLARQIAGAIAEVLR